MPLRSKDKDAYLRWAVDAFRLATSGVADSTQIHTHLCYSEFGEVIGAIADLDADVTSIEAARSHMEVLDDLNAVGFANSVGPGVYDIHSPRVPGVDEMAESLREALKAVPAERLWVNPDCGLKTRTTDEVTASLRTPGRPRPRRCGRLTARHLDAGGAQMPRRPSVVDSGATPAVRSSRTRVVKPASAASAAVAFTQ